VKRSRRPRLLEVQPHVAVATPEARADHAGPARDPNQETERRPSSFPRWAELLSHTKWCRPHDPGREYQGGMWAPAKIQADWPADLEQPGEKQDRAGAKENTRAPFKTTGG